MYCLLLCIRIYIAARCKNALQSLCKMRQTAGLKMRKILFLYIGRKKTFILQRTVIKAMLKIGFDVSWIFEHDNMQVFQLLASLVCHRLQIASKSSRETVFNGTQCTQTDVNFCNSCCQCISLSLLLHMIFLTFYIDLLCWLLSRITDTSQRWTISCLNGVCRVQMLNHFVKNREL